MQTVHRSFLGVIAILLLLLIATFVSIAQVSNDPNDNPDANACFEEGTLEGICNTTDADRDGDIDQQDKDWLWTCGWYLIRVEYGIFDSSLLHNICHDVIEAVVVEETVAKKKKKKEDAIEEIAEIVCEEIDAGTYRIVGGDGTKFTDEDCTIPQD